MQSPCLNQLEQVCPHGCCPSPLFGLPETNHTTIGTTTRTSTSSACRKKFTSTTTTSFFPNTQFTDHESLPPLKESIAKFIEAYPQYSDAARIDRIRAQEYYHLSLSNRICFDYIGIGLFSHLQLQNHQFSIIPVGSPALEKDGFPDFPFFSTTYKSVNLKSQLLHGGEGSELESSIRSRIMSFLNISDDDYCMVFTPNKSSAFKIVSETYPFQTSRKLLTVYDYKSEASDAMISASEKRGARFMSAEFKWPRLRIHSAKLRKMVERKRKKKKMRGLFVFPLQSRTTGASYSYQWMKLAQENGWHVLLDACALGPKDMDSFGLSLIHPDFLICSFYKVFGENPTGFGCLFVKKSIVSILEDSTSIGIATIVPGGKPLFQAKDDYSSGSIRDLEIQQDFGKGETSETPNKILVTFQEEKSSQMIEYRGLDQVDSLGLILISTRTRCLINWLVNALMKLEHPNTETRTPLVEIYGPRVRFNRGPALAFNVYDWKGEKVDAALVQKLADRSNISLSLGFLHHIWFAEEKERMVMGGNAKKNKCELGMAVVTGAIGFLANFEDVYRLWAFIARFLDADFVEKERWRYTALDQKTVEL